MTLKARIALFMPALAGGGAERFMLTLAEDLAEKGLLVDLVVANARGPLLDDIPDNIRLVDLQARRIVTSIIPLRRYIRKVKPHVMLAAMAPANCIAVCARILANSQFRLILTERNTPTPASSGSLNWRGRLLPALMRWSYHRADAVLAVSHGVADDLAAVIKMPRNRIAVIYNPVVTSVKLEKSYASVNHPWFAPGAPPVILGVGRLTRQKDFPTLIRAFSKLRENKDARLMILGEGEDRAQLEVLARDLGIDNDVAMPGFTSNPYAYMRQAALFVLSSRWEGLPAVLIEAMAFGTTVVSTECPSGPREILEDGKWGSLIPVGNVTELAAAMEDGINVPRTSVEIRGNYFSRQKAIQAYMEVLFPGASVMEGISRASVLNDDH